VKQQGKTIPQPNYVRKLQYLRRVGALPDGVVQVDIYHDGWCAHFQGRACNCAPELRVRWVQSDVAKN
jgi:hypothetical protein